MAINLWLDTVCEGIHYFLTKINVDGGKHLVVYASILKINVGECCVGSLSVKLFFCCWSKTS